LSLGPARLVAVLLADQGVALGMIAHLRDAGFAGVMLDTSDKQGGPLPARVPAETLRAFVADARAAGLFAGLAGSLAAEHVSYLTGFAPDVLGFRGGLCHRGVRADAIDAVAVNAVRRAIDDAGKRASGCGTPQGDVIARRQPKGAI
jgi:uncharacterized protein (UPF0264 family)